MQNMQVLVGQYLQLEKSGSVSKALCPFHNDEKTKSFTVYQDAAYCFGCGRYFTPITFLMEYLHLSKEAALKKLGVLKDLPALPSFDNATPQVVKPIPIEIIKNWHTMLKPLRREYYHSRLFTDETIDRELWGWDGYRYVVTVWDGKPGFRCISVRRRARGDAEPKYLGYKDHNPRVLYNLWNATQRYETWPSDTKRVLYLFFGEFDAALAFQDGLPAISPTNGQNAWLDEWDLALSPYTLVIIPDKGEELRGFQVASRFPCNATVVYWPGSGEFDDYNSFRLRGGTVEDFMGIVGRSDFQSFTIECYYESPAGRTSNPCGNLH